MTGVARHILPANFESVTAPGTLIVFEGPEGVGKSTQVGMLMDALGRAGVDAVTFREPGGTSTGNAIRTLLLDPASQLDAATEALLFMASRAELCAREVRPALERGLVVVLDRFFLSTYAYQIHGRGLPEAEIRAANRLATGGIVPDLTLLLDLPVESGLARATARAEKDRMERSTADFHGRVAASFASFATDAWTSAHPECGRVFRVDARGSRDEVFARVTGVLAAEIPERFASLHRAATSVAS